jgi:hypothetical protein
MDLEGKANVTTATDNIRFAHPVPTFKPLVLLRDTEALLRRPTIAAIKPILPPRLSRKLQSASNLADDSLQNIAEIDLEQISDWELQPARIFIGLTFVGLGALMILLLLLYLNTLHPELNPVQQIRQYWYQYIWFVCLGIAGMFLVGREAMRPTGRK